MNFLIVIPLYNHGATVAQVVEKALATGLDVLVVDDGSTDGGSRELASLACTLIGWPDNRGKGAAIMAAADYAHEHNYDAIITVDADGQHDPADVAQLICCGLEQWPAIVIGNRQMVEETVPQSSKFGRQFSNFWVRLECGAELPDTQSGLRLYPVALLQFLGLKARRYDFEIEVLVRAAWAGVQLRSADVSVHYPPGKERISHFHKGFDNIRLGGVHSRLLFRRLLPLPERRLLPQQKSPAQRLVIGNPFKALKRLCLEHTSPFWLALAVWLGIFMGALPILAAHTVAIIYVAHRLHINKVAAVAASQFCMPPVVPVLCIQTGYFMLHQELLLDFSWEKWLLEGHYRLLDWLLGSLLLGPLLGLVGGVIMYYTASRLQQLQRHYGRGEIG